MRGYMRAITFAGFLAMAAVAACGGAPDVQAARDRAVVRLVRNFETSIDVALAEEYSRTMPEVDIRLVQGSGPRGTVEALQQGEADVGFMLADVAYFAQGDAQRRHDASAELRAMAALQTTAVHVLARSHVSLSPLAGQSRHRVGINPGFTAQFMLARLVLNGYGLSQGAEPRQLAPAEIASALRTGLVDAAFVTSYYPSASVTAATEQGARLVSMDGAVSESIRRTYPFVNLVSIPAYTYPGQEQSVRTIGVNRLLVCRSDLDESLVHDLTARFIEALPSVSEPIRASVRLTDLDSASATPIPLHRGAARYYRERELAP